MKSSTTKIASTFVLGAAVSVAGGACGPSGGGGNGEGGGEAFLTIVGDRSVFLENGAQADLEVRYHDKDELPLQGTVEYAVEGEMSGAQLTGSSATTNEEGVAALTLDATNEEATTFTVRASAPEAGSVSWEVTLEEPWVPLEPQGTYAASSEFDMVTGLEEGTTRDVVHGVRDFTDDPGTYLLELAAEAAIDECGSFCSFLEDVAVATGPLLTAYLEDEFPQLVNDLIYLGDGFVTMAERFGLESDLIVSGETDAYTVDHRTSGVVLYHEGTQHPFTMAEMGLEPTVTEGVDFTVTSNDRSVEVAEHAVPLAYGTMLVVALEEVLLAAIEGQPSDLGSFLNSRIDCVQVGAFLEEEIDGLPVAPFGVVIYSGEDLCEDGIDVGASAITNEIQSLDDLGLQLHISGSAEPSQPDDNGKAATLDAGRWNGTMEHNESLAATFETDATRFSAERVGD